MHVVAPPDRARKRAADEIAGPPGPRPQAPAEPAGAPPDDPFGSPGRRRPCVESAAETSPIQGLVRPSFRGVQAARSTLGRAAAESGHGALRQEALRQQLAEERATHDHLRELGRLDRERATSLERQNVRLRAELGRLGTRRQEQDDRIITLEEHCAALEAHNTALDDQLTALGRGRAAVDAAADEPDTRAGGPADMTCGESLDWTEG